MTINGINGMLFTSKINNKQLFIPFAGYWYDGTFNSLGSSADMWSSQVQVKSSCDKSSFDYRTNSLYCSSSNNVNIANILISHRTCAFSVRGVFNK